MDQLQPSTNADKLSELNSKKVGHRVWAYFRARIAWTTAAFNLLARWGLEMDDENMVCLSIAEFSL